MQVVRRIILGFIDFFYPLFRRFFSKQTFRYLACGGGNTLFDIFLYFVCYNFILHKQDIFFGDPDTFLRLVPEAVKTQGGIRIASHIAAFIFSFSITFPLGFFLSKYIVFSDSTIKGRVQLMRYALLVGSCILLNYIFIKLFVEVLHFYPTIAKTLTTAIVAVYSYYAQRRFTFKVPKELVVK